MNIDLNKQVLPQIFKRRGKECYLDLIREKLILITPEETVRQRVVSYLIHNLHVPKEMITVEEHLSHYGIDSKRRADIVIHRCNNNQGTLLPLAVIECKAPDVLLGEKAVNQVLDYADLLLCDYVMLTDGNSYICYKFDSEENCYVNIEALPDYRKMLKGNYVCMEQTPVLNRVPFDELEQNLYQYQNCDIGKDTEISKALPSINLLECLLDVSHKMPTGKYALYTLIEDYGVRLLSYGNASGGVFPGAYRSFLIEKNGSTEFVSIGLSPYTTWAKQNIQKTAINVAIDNDKNSHHALQLVVDENLVVSQEKCSFYHHGRIGIGNIGSGRVSELKEFVKNRYNSIIYENQYYLGQLDYNKLWYMDDKQVIDFVENLISYALIRDEYREHVKKKYKKIKSTPTVSVAIQQND